MSLNLQLLLLYCTTITLSLIIPASRHPGIPSSIIPIRCSKKINALLHTVASYLDHKIILFLFQQISNFEKMAMEKGGQLNLRGMIQLDKVYLKINNL
jgi:hypothetical protein